MLLSIYIYVYICYICILCNLERKKCLFVKKKKLVAKNHDFKNVPEKKYLLSFFFYSFILFLMMRRVLLQKLHIISLHLTSTDTQHRSKKKNMLQNENFRSGPR